MTQPIPLPSPPIPRNQAQVDAGHLKLLAIFHFVLAGFSLMGIGFLFLHGFIMRTVFANPEMWKNQQGGPPPQEIFTIFTIIYVVIGLMIVLSGLANVLSGFFILKRRNRIFSMVIAGLNCMAFPFGTALGVFTLVVLSRDSVREAYTVTVPSATGLRTT
jgi:hypothetical protein